MATRARDIIKQEWHHDPALWENALTISTFNQVVVTDPDSGGGDVFVYTVVGKIKSKYYSQSDLFGLRNLN